MKNFDEWNILKQKIDNRESIRTFQEREIWWCSVGINVGSEIYGKSDVYSRPVLIIKKFNKYRFLGAPLTSQCDDRLYRCPIIFKGKEGRVVCDQIRSFDARRLLGTKEVKLGKNQFEAIKEFYKSLI